jgi:hypothetical protein
MPAFDSLASASGAACRIAVESDATAASSTPSIGTTRTVVLRGGPDTGNCTTEIIPISCVLDAGRRNRLLGLRGSSSAVAASGMCSGTGDDPDFRISQIGSGSGTTSAFPLVESRLVGRLPGHSFPGDGGYSMPNQYANPGA